MSECTVHISTSLNHNYSKRRHAISFIDNFHMIIWTHWMTYPLFSLFHSGKYILRIYHASVALISIWLWFNNRIYHTKPFKSVNNEWFEFTLRSGNWNVLFTHNHFYCSIMYNVTHNTSRQVKARFRLKTQMKGWIDRKNQDRNLFKTLIRNLLYKSNH